MDAEQDGIVCGMDILAAVKAERDKLNRVIALLEPTPTTIPHTAKKQGHKWTDAERKAMSLKQKAAWAKRRKAKKA
jgi:alanyl-tRNA synthetase